MWPQMVLWSCLEERESGLKWCTFMPQSDARLHCFGSALGLNSVTTKCIPMQPSSTKGSEHDQRQVEKLHRVHQHHQHG